MTLLHWACDRGYEDIVEYLIGTKCDINSQVSTVQLDLACVRDIRTNSDGGKVVIIFCLLLWILFKWLKA